MALIDEVAAARRLPPPEVARAIRRAARVSQRRLADELRVHRVTVARWEAGMSEPTGPLRVRYADLLTELGQAVGQSYGRAA